MKNKTKYIVAALLLVLVGCSENFLDTKPEGDLLVCNYFSKPEDFTSLTNPLYGRPWFDYLDKASSGIGELLSGNGVNDEDPLYFPFYKLTLTPDHSQINLAWSTFYGVIAQANLIMHNVRLVETSGDDAMEAARNITLGECKFFRAISYFYLVQYFGDVPIVLDNVIELQDIQKPKVFSKDIYELIIRDLTDAISKLPSTVSQPRIGKIAAKALLSKVYLTRAGLAEIGTDADFSQAATLADQAIIEGISAGYDLMENYHDLWLFENNNNKESLFAWQWKYGAAFADFGIQNTLQSYFAPSDFTKSWDGWSAVVPSIDLIQSWEDGDLRRYSTMMEDGNYYPEFWINSGGYTYNAQTCNYGGPTDTRTSIRKHLQGAAGEDGHIDPMHTELYTPIIRIADLYLTYAEAILGRNISTSDAKALEYFNQIRQRAGLAPKLSITFEDILAERRHEFAFEFSYWSDILRYHNLYPTKAITMLLNQERGIYRTTPPYTLNSFKLVQVTDDNFLVPIPSSETIADEKLRSGVPSEPFDFSEYE